MSVTYLTIHLYVPINVMYCSCSISGLTWAEAKERCPEGVVPACHNAEDTVTISGPVDALRDFVAQLKEEGYFAREVDSNGVAFHSHYMSAVAPKLKEQLSKVILICINV